MKNLKNNIISFGLFFLLLVGCTNDLNTEPKVQITLEQLLAQDPNAVTGLLSKSYVLLHYRDQTGLEAPILVMIQENLLF
jgi:hypothetical protein